MPQQQGHTEQTAQTSSLEQLTTAHKYADNNFCTLMVQRFDSYKLVKARNKCAQPAQPFDSYKLVKAKCECDPVGTAF